MMKKEKMKGMGGRGSSSGVSVKGKAYGTEYTTLHESGNIKFVRYNDSKSSKTPIETMTNRRVYVTIDNRGISGTPEPTPLNMSAKEFRQRVESNGATTKAVSNAEYKKAEKAYQKERDSRPDYELGIGLKDNSAYRRTARKNRVMNRVMKRK